MAGIPVIVRGAATTVIVLCSPMGLPAPPPAREPSTSRSVPAATIAGSSRPHAEGCPAGPALLHPGRWRAPGVPVGPKYWNALFSLGLQSALNQLASLNFALL